MKPPSRQKSPQRNLFGAEPSGNAAPRWHDGATIEYLGGRLCLKLATDRRQAMRENDVLHLPLPPDATPRQIQDAAESWLRRQAEVLFSRLIADEAQRRCCELPTLSLSFAARGSWTQVDGNVLRLNWRLIEQPIAVIELTLRRALALVPSSQQAVDLFGALVS